MSKSVFVTKFSWANLAVNFSSVSLLNSGVLNYLSWIWSVIFFSVSLLFVLWSAFMTKLLTSDISFSTAINPVVVGKSLILGILLSITVNLPL